MNTSTDPDARSLGALLAILHEIFRPSTPTRDPAMFKGRADELNGVMNAVQQLGQHVIVYGDRGVGKTSLAYMARDAFLDASQGVGLVIRVPCETEDDFATVWNKATEHLRGQVDKAPDDVAASLGAAVDKYEDIVQFSNTVTPGSVARALEAVSGKVPLVVILDEFDRFSAWEDTVKFAELIKTLSDSSVKCTVFIVGVADDVSGLILGHQSVDRALRQVHMPQMTQDELAQIVTDGFSRFADRSGIGITVTPDAVHAIASLSLGFPYYTHLLAGTVGAIALQRERYEVSRLDVTRALFRATAEATQSIQVAYTDAVASSSGRAQFDLTLLACALAPCDELGYFAPKDVTGPLSQLCNRTRRPSDFNRHLKRFTEPPLFILDTRGEGSITRYRFHDPLMKPYIRMKGVNSGNFNLPDTGDAADDKES